jgi:hypothetical protein
MLDNIVKKTKQNPDNRKKTKFNTRGRQIQKLDFISFYTKGQHDWYNVCCEFLSLLRSEDRTERPESPPSILTKGEEL